MWTSYLYAPFDLMKRPHKEFVHSLYIRNPCRLTWQLPLFAAIPPVTVQFDQNSVNSSEGNSAVVCVSAIFMGDAGLEVGVGVLISVTGQGTAGMLHLHDCSIFNALQQLTSPSA